MSGSRFEGQELSEYLADYHNITRKDGESDWELRKRAFVETFGSDPVAAIEFLFGCHQDDILTKDKWLVVIATTGRNNKEGLASFIEGFREDPMFSRSNAKRARQ